MIIYNWSISIRGQTDSTLACWWKTAALGVGLPVTNNGNYGVGG